MRPLHLVFMLMSGAYSRSLLGTAQEMLPNKDITRQKVVGANPAYYTRVREEDQLFEVGDFIVSPKTPFGRFDNRVFFYLRGYVNTPLPGLENATLTLRSKIRGEEFEYTTKLSEAKVVTLRDDAGVYGGPLTMFGNQLVGDVELYHFMGPKVVPFYIEVDARLPDDRVLFAFGAELEMTI